jgi:hypothetical protein
MKFPNLNKNITAIYVASTIAGILTTAPIAALADDSGFQTDYTVKLQTETLQKQFQYKGSILTKVTKASIEYYANADNKKQPYENVWFNDGHPIGLERLAPFGLEKGKSASLVVTHKAQGGVQEEKAAASMILRLVLDAYNNTDSFLAIRVPPQSFGGIIRELENLRCVDTNPAQPDEASKAKLTFTIETDEENGQIKHLFYM